MVSSSFQILQYRQRLAVQPLRPMVYQGVRTEDSNVEPLTWSPMAPPEVEDLTNVDS